MCPAISAWETGANKLGMALCLVWLGGWKTHPTAHCLVWEHTHTQIHRAHSHTLTDTDQVQCVQPSVQWETGANKVGPALCLVWLFAWMTHPTAQCLVCEHAHIPTHSQTQTKSSVSSYQCMGNWCKQGWPGFVLGLAFWLEDTPKGSVLGL